MLVDHSGFEYVVRKQEQHKICFGSGCPRDTSTKQGMNSFMRYYAAEEYPNISPCKYNALESFKAIKSKPCSSSISKKGYSGIARFEFLTQHTDEYPAPCDYSTDNFPAKVKELKYPFASTAKIRTFLVNKNPGPGMYVNAGKREIIFDHSFGGRVKMRLGVELKCCKLNMDTCNICRQKPSGDYWHLGNKIFLCRPCMIKERRKHAKFTRGELQLFHKQRDCSEIHLHDGTSANIWLMHPRIVDKWNRSEAYLSAYLKD